MNNCAESCPRLPWCDSNITRIETNYQAVLESSGQYIDDTYIERLTDHDALGNIPSEVTDIAGHLRAQQAAKLDDLENALKQAKDERTAMLEACAEGTVELTARRGTREIVATLCGSMAVEPGVVVDEPVTVVRHDI